MSDPIVFDGGNFKSDSFKPVASKMWKELLDNERSYSLAHWVIDANSVLVRLTGKNIDESELSPDWKPSRTIFARTAAGFELDRGWNEEEFEVNTVEHRKWAEAGIIETFQSKTIQRIYANSACATKDFTIVSSEFDDGLTVTEFKILWAAKRSFKTKEIKDRQLAARKAVGRYVAVKKRPSK